MQRLLGRAGGFSANLLLTAPNGTLFNRLHERSTAKLLMQLILRTEQRISAA